MSGYLDGEGESDGDGDARGDTDGEAGGVDPVARVGVVPGWKADRAKTPASPRATTTASSAPSERARPPRLRCRPLAPIGYRRLPDGRAGGGSATEPPPIGLVQRENEMVSVTLPDAFFSIVMWYCPFT